MTIVALVVAEERANAVGPQIRDTKLSASRQDDWVGEDNLMLVDATLEVAEDIETAGCVVAEVAEGLHHLSPRRGLVIPAGVAVELLIILDKRLDE